MRIRDVLVFVATAHACLYGCASDPEGASPTAAPEASPGTQASGGAAGGEGGADEAAAPAPGDAGGDAGRADASVPPNPITPATCAPGETGWSFVKEVPPPATMAPYERFTMSATFKNCTGATVPRVDVAAPAGLKLGFTTPRDYDPFGMSRVALPAAVPTAHAVTIPIVLRAPPLTGTYYLQWGLLDEGKAWLPAVSTAHGVNVEAAAKTASICPGVSADIGGAAPANAAIQSCIDATPPGGVLALPAGVYRIDGQLTLAKPITLVTAGADPAMPGCWDHDSPACVVLRAGPTLDVPRGFLYVTSGSAVHLDRIVLDGNRNARLGSAAAATCAGGTNGAGFNAHSDDCAACSFTRGMSARALCGTGWEWVGDDAAIEGNVFYQNGDHVTKMMWSDGLTLLRSNGARVRDNRFVDDSDVDFICGGAENAVFTGNRVAHVLQASFAGIMWDNFNGGTPGKFVGASLAANVVDCGAQLCDFGIELGPHPWYPSANIEGGKVTGNTVTGAKIQINAEGAGTAASPVTVSGNALGPSPATAVYGCGQSRKATAFNVSPDSVVVTSDGTAAFTYHSCP
jgi:hypothetical protein